MSRSLRVIAATLLAVVVAWSVEQSLRYTRVRPRPPVVATKLLTSDRTTTKMYRVSSRRDAVRRIGGWGFANVAVLTHRTPTRVLVRRHGRGGMTALTYYARRSPRRGVVVAQTTPARAALGGSFVVRYTEQGITYRPSRAWVDRGYLLSMSPAMRTEPSLRWAPFGCMTSSRFFPRAELNCP